MIRNLRLADQQACIAALVCSKTSPSHYLYQLTKSPPRGGTRPQHTNFFSISFGEIVAVQHVPHNTPLAGHLLAAQQCYDLKKLHDDVIAHVVALARAL